jgi:hypothetical protein
MTDLSSLGAALTSVKTLWELAKNAQDAQLAMKISAELGTIQGQLIDVQQQTLAIQQENHQLRGEIAKYKTFVQHHSVMWRQIPDGKEDGPFCPVCIAADREMRLLVVPQADPGLEYWFLCCPAGHNKLQGFQTAPFPHFYVPKELVPENYFSSPHRR